jgi:hypothetical protein
MNEERSHEKREIIDAWRRGKPFEGDRRRPPTSVLSIRIPTEILQELTDRAVRANKPASQYARELIEDCLASEPGVGPSIWSRLFSRWVAEADQVVPDVKWELSSSVCKVFEYSWVDGYLSVSEGKTGPALHNLLSDLANVVRETTEEPTAAAAADPQVA